MPANHNPGTLPTDPVPAIPAHPHSPSAPSRGSIGRFLWRLVGEPWQRIQKESRDYLATPAAQKFDGKVAWVLVVAAVVLTLQNYFGSKTEADRWLRAFGLNALADWMAGFFNDIDQWQFRGLCYWALFSTFTYIVPPLLVIVLVFREPLGNYGTKVKGALREWWLYLIFLA